MPFDFAPTVQLNEDEEESSLLHESTVDFDASTLSLTVGASVEYVGLAADGNFDDVFNLGTTYWIDFQSFSGSTDSIAAAGSCGNRESADYSGLAFDEYWSYPSNPEDLGTTDTDQRMAYPPSNWTVVADGCDEVEYERTFSWSELRSCTDAEGQQLVTVTETADAVLLEGTFYVILVSPYSMSSDEYYRAAPLLQQDFGVELMRTINVIASTGTQLFIPSVIGYQRDNGDYTSYALRGDIHSMV